MCGWSLTHNNGRHRRQPQSQVTQQQIGKISWNASHVRAQSRDTKHYLVMAWSQAVVVAFSLLVRILGERSSISRLRFFFFFNEVEISSRTLIPFFMPGSVHSGSASLYDCVRLFPDELRVSSFPDRFPHYALTAA